MFGTDTDIDRMQHRLSQWAQGFADKAEQFHAMRAQVERIQVTESSADGAVKVTVDSTGALTDLTLTDKINGRPPSEIAHQVMACLRRAQQQLAGRVQDAMAAAVGGGEPVVEHVVSGYRQRFGDDQQAGPQPDPTRRHRPAPPDDDTFEDRNYLC